VTHGENIAHTLEYGRHVCQTDLTGSNNPNYGNHTLSERYANDKAFAMEKQSRPGVQNGRATPVRAFFSDGVHDFDYFTQCARYMIDQKMVRTDDECCVATYISKAAKSGRKYFGYSFELL